MRPVRFDSFPNFFLCFDVKANGMVQICKAISSKVSRLNLSLISDWKFISGEIALKPTDIKDPEYFHNVVDCQYACPAHTPVPEYIRLIAEGRYTEAYMINWDSNVFPGVLGRTCDRPCEPACRRGRLRLRRAKK